jgi:hypothetical protein
MTRFLSKIALALVTLAVALGIGEGVVRLLFKDSMYLYPRYHTDYRYGTYVIRGTRPSSEFWHTSVDGSWKFVTNSRGFRNTKDFDYERTPGIPRVLTLGDSHTQGYEVRQEFTYSAVLERTLAKHAGDAEVINTGVSGFSTAEELVLLENEGLKYHPDAVVVGFFANDFEDNLKAGLFELDAENRLVEQRFEHIPGVRVQNVIYSLPPVRWLGENSYFYSLLFNGVWDFFKNRLTASALAEAATTAGDPSAATSRSEYAIPTASSYTANQIALAATLLERMHEICTQRGIRFIVVDIPVLGEQPFTYLSSVPPELAQRLAAAEIELVSSHDLLREFEGKAGLHVEHGHRHISEFTHTMIGVEIGRRLAASAPE